MSGKNQENSGNFKVDNKWQPCHSSQVQIHEAHVIPGTHGVCSVQHAYT